MLPRTRTSAPTLAVFLALGCGLSHGPIASEDVLATPDEARP